MLGSRSRPVGYASICSPSHANSHSVSMHRRLFECSQVSFDWVHDASLTGSASVDVASSSRSMQKRLCTRSPTHTLGANLAQRASLFEGGSSHSTQSSLTSVQYSPSTSTILSGQDGCADAWVSDGDCGSFARL